MIITKEEDLLIQIKNSNTVEEFKKLSKEFFKLKPSYNCLVRYLLTERFNDYQDKDRVYKLILNTREFGSNPIGSILRLSRLCDAAKFSNIKLNFQIFADYFLKQGNITDIKYFYKYIDKKFYNSVKFETYLMFE